MTENTTPIQGRKALLLGAGYCSQTGDARRQFRSFLGYCQNGLGYTSTDFFEISYNGSDKGADWKPSPYLALHTERPLQASTQVFVRHLQWLDRVLPQENEIHLIGYSLAGCLFLSAACDLLRLDSAHWSQRVASVTTLASPHFGTNLDPGDGPIESLLSVFGELMVFPTTEAVMDLRNQARDRTHRATVERQAELLQQAGIRLLTLASETDAIVTPEESVIAPDHARSQYIVNTSGHGPILESPEAWEMIGEVIGRQNPSPLRAGGAANLPG